MRVEHLNILMDKQYLAGGLSLLLSFHKLRQSSHLTFTNLGPGQNHPLLYSGDGFKSVPRVELVQTNVQTAIFAAMDRNLWRHQP